MLDLGLVEPRDLIDLYEFYDHDVLPGATGFDPDDAQERFCSEELTWNGFAYRREIKGLGQGRSDILKYKGEKLNSVTINFSNISRYAATWAQTTEIEGMIVVIRCIAPSATDDSIVLFTGKAGKPSTIDKREFALACEQYFGDNNVLVPPRKFENSDPEGRLPSDPLYEGIDFVRINGSVTFPEVVPTDSRIGRLLGRRRVTYRTEQYSSWDLTPLGRVIPEIFGRCQMELIVFAGADKGSHVGFLAAISNGPIAAVTNLKSRTEGMGDPVCTFAVPPAPAVVHLGDPGGTGTNNGNTCQADLAGGRFFSGLAYIEAASLASDPEAAVATQEGAPTVTGLVKGRVIPLPDSSGVYNQTGWTDNPVHITRFALTDPRWFNINEAFMEDTVNYRTALHCDEPIIDNTGSQIIVVPGPDIAQAGSSLIRVRSTGLIRPRLILYNEFGDASVIPEFEDGPYVGVDTGSVPLDPSDPTDPTYLSQLPLLKRYTASFPLTEEMKGSDFLQKILLPVFKGYIRTNKHGKLEILSEQAADATRLRTATSVNATSIPVLNVEPWKTGLELLKGQVRLGGLGSTDSEVRKPSAAVYSASGNSVTLTVTKTGTITIAASGATLTGGSTTVQASGTITIGGTPAAGNTVTATIDGIAVQYVLEAADTTGTVAAMLHYRINADQRLNKFIRAVWSPASPTVIAILCLHGALTVPALLKAHSAGIADPSSAPAVAAASGSLAAGTYKIAYSDVTAAGSTALTPQASLVLTANQQINLSSLPALVGTSRDFYISEKANSNNLRYVATRTDNSNFSINSLPLPGAALPPSYNTTAEELIRVAMSFATNSQDVLPAWSASTLVLLNDVYLPTTANGHKYQVTTQGPTGTTEPTWPTGAGATVASGSAVFTEIGSTVLQQAGLTRANIRKDTFKWPLGSKQSSVNQIKGNYRSPKDDFALIPFIINDRAHQARVKKKYPLEVDLPAVDNFNQMSRLGNFHLSLNREGDWHNSLGTGPQGLVLEEGDVICSSDDSGGLVNVVTRIEELRIKPNHEVDIVSARKYSTEMFSDDVGSHRIPLPSTLKFIATKDSLFNFIDIPAIRDSEEGVPGLKLAVSHDLDLQGDWRGWALWVDFGDGYTLLQEGDVPATMGTATTTLSTVADINVLDEVGVLTTTFDYADAGLAFTNLTEAEMLANPRRNLLLYKDELLQAGTIVDNGGRSFTFTDLLRGRFETDDQLTHSASERVVYMNGAEAFVPMDVSRANQAFNYKVVTTNQDLDDVSPHSFTWLGRSLKTAKPTSFIGNFDTVSGDLLNEWSGTEFPADPSREIYELEIRNDADTATLRSVVVAPSQIRDQSEPILWEIVPSASSSDMTLLSDGGIECLTLGPSDPPVEATSITTASVVDGLLVEFEVAPEGRLPLFYFMLHPEDELPTFGNDYTMTWRRTFYSGENKFYMTPEGFDSTSPIKFPIVGGDRYGILIRADGIAEYYINYLGQSSNPVWISSKLTKHDVLYQLRVHQQSGVVAPGDEWGFKNARWVRRGPEWRYFADAQRLDFGLDAPDLPAEIKVRVRQRSPYLDTVASSWVNGVFTR